MTEGSAAEPPVLNTVSSLLVGSAIEAGDQLAQRLRQWQAATDRRGREIYSESPDESEQERLRYALLGLLAQTPKLAEQALSTALDGARQAAFDGEDEVIDQVIGVMGDKPEVRQLVTQQGKEFANQMDTFAVYAWDVPEDE